MFLSFVHGLQKRLNQYSDNLAAFIVIRNKAFIRRSAMKHLLEYVLINNDVDELWEIDYERKLAINVSEYVRIESIKAKLIRYFGTIEDFLINERSCKNIHFHKNMPLPERIHTETCSFDMKSYVNDSNNNIA
jgi:hypothetical protein